MAGTTPNKALPYLGLGDAPDIAKGLQDLATAVDTHLTRMDTQETQQVFTADGTYTKPAGLKAVRVRVQGGGGGGGAAGGTVAAQASCGGGGGGGGYAEEIIPAASLPNSPTTVAVTVGAGGTAGAAGSGTAGGTGGTSSFGAFLSATGGGGGNYGTSSAAVITGGGAPGVGSGGTLNVSGQVGPTARVLLGEPTMPAPGGDSVLGNGAQTALATTGGAGIAGNGYGGGGSGGHLRASQVTLAGGAGAPGVVIVENLF